MAITEPCICLLYTSVFGDEIGHERIAWQQINAALALWDAVEEEYQDVYKRQREHRPIHGQDGIRIAREPSVVQPSHAHHGLVALHLIIIVLALHSRCV